MIIVKPTPRYATSYADIRQEKFNIENLLTRHSGEGRNPVDLL